MAWLSLDAHDDNAVSFWWDDGLGKIQPSASQCEQRVVSLQLGSGCTLAKFYRFSEAV
jgi:hypothetical protein